MLEHKRFIKLCIIIEITFKVMEKRIHNSNTIEIIRKYITLQTSKKLIFVIKLVTVSNQDLLSVVEQIKNDTLL